jgi:heat shock protein HslJ
MRTVLRAMVLFLALAACGAQQVPTDEPPEIDVEGTWRLTSGRVDGRAVAMVEDWPITLTVEGSSISGTAGCNGYGARLVGRNGAIGVDGDGIASSAMACEPDAVMDAEAAYLAALGTLTAITVDGDELVVTGPDVELRFEAVPPVNTAALVGTRWVLETIVVGDVAQPVVGEPATLEMGDDGTVTGSTGCRSFTGTWTEADGRILLTSMAMDGSECPAALVDQDNLVVSLVGDGFRPTIEGDMLTLVDPGSLSGVYRAGER